MKHNCTIFLQKRFSIQPIKYNLVKARKPEFMGDVNYLNELVHLRSKSEYFPLLQTTVNVSNSYLYKQFYK